MSTEMTSWVQEIVEDFLYERDGRRSDVAPDDNLLELAYLDSEEFFTLISVVEEKLNVVFDFLEADPADLVSIAGLSRQLAKQHQSAPR